MGPRAGQREKSPSPLGNCSTVPRMYSPVVIVPTALKKGAFQCGVKCDPFWLQFLTSHWPCFSCVARMWFIAVRVVRCIQSVCYRHSFYSHSSKVLKCGAGEGWRRSVGPIM